MLKTPYQLIRNDTAKHYRAIRNILRSSYTGQRDWLPFLLLIVALTLVILIKGCDSPAMAAVTDKQAVSIIVGEASNQGIIGMTAVAEVLRHRNSVKGFYGLNAKHSYHEPVWVWNMAKKAWQDSKTSNYTHQANHFENIHAFGKPYWVTHCTETFRYRDHVFYMEMR